MSSETAYLKVALDAQARQRAAKQATRQHRLRLASQSTVNSPGGLWLDGGSMAADHRESHRHQPEATTQVDDLPEACLAQAIALTSPRDAIICAAVSPAFRAAADSDHVWHRFLPRDLLLRPLAPIKSSISKKEAYLGLCDANNAAGALGVDDDGCRVWLERASGAWCCAMPARRLSLPWEDGEFSWKWTTHRSTRFGEVAELVHCTCLDIYARLPSAALLTPATPYAAYLVYGTSECHRGLSFPDQETAVTVGGREVARHAVCLIPDDAEARKFRGDGAAAGREVAAVTRRPSVREDGWWEMEMGRLCAAGEEEEVVASFEVLGWYPKRGLILESVEFRPLPAC